MNLTLSILRCPEGVATDTRRITGGTLAIGRGPANEWVLPDPDRVLSKRHCVIALVGESWQVSDTSVNGTFVNGVRVQMQALPPGDIVQFGNSKFRFE